MLSSEPQVATTEISPRDDALILCTGKFWDVMSPGAVSLATHFFLEYAREQRMVSTARELDAGAREGETPSLAAHLVHQAVGWPFNGRSCPWRQTFATLTLTLDWHGQVTSSSMACSRAAAVRRARQETVAQRRARRRWALVRCQMDTLRAWKRALLHSWHDLAARSYAQGRVRAKALQEQLYFTKGIVTDVSPSLKIKATTGVTEDEELPVPGLLEGVDRSWVLSSKAGEK